MVVRSFLCCFLENPPEAPLTLMFGTVDVCDLILERKFHSETCSQATVASIQTGMHVTVENTQLSKSNSTT